MGNGKEYRRRGFPTAAARLGSEAWRGVILICLMVLLPLFLPGTGRADGELRFAALGNFPLENGRIIEDCRLGYRTFGRLNPERTNAVLFPTWLAGASEDLARHGYIGPARLADTGRYFVIAVDALGNGVSSSPSRSATQGGRSFPEFSVRDMVRAQHELLTKHLGLTSLHAVIGISMGGMQAFEWRCSYPGFARKVVPIMASPRLTTADLLIFTAELRAIEGARRCPEGEVSGRQALAAIHAYGIRNPGYYGRQVPPAEFPALLAGMEKNLAGYNLDDWARQLEAIMSQNSCLPSAAAPAEIFVIVARDDMLVNPESALAYAGTARGKSLELTGGCGHFAFMCEGEKIRAAVAAFLNGEDIKAPAQR